MTLEFTPFPKLARLNREITITEKIDGTNAAVVIVPVDGGAPVDTRAIALVPTPEARERGEGDCAAVFAQSRTRFITPEADNYGFAKWVKRNAEALVATLGAGTHFGEWWGAGIQRKYGLTGSDKRFSLFNTARWAEEPGSPIDTRPSALREIPGLHHVPVLYRGIFSEGAVLEVQDGLRALGSFAEPGFMNPEGIVIWHGAARQGFKVTLVGDESPKGPAGHRFDEEKQAVLR